MFQRSARQNKTGSPKPAAGFFEINNKSNLHCQPLCARPRVHARMLATALVYNLVHGQHADVFMPRPSCRSRQQSRQISTLPMFRRSSAGTTKLDPKIQQLSAAALDQISNKSNLCSSKLCARLRVHARMLATGLVYKQAHGQHDGVLCPWPSCRSRQRSTPMFHRSATGTTKLVPQNQQLNFT
jgi:hypothetical protein